MSDLHSAEEEQVTANNLIPVVRQGVRRPDDA